MLGRYLREKRTSAGLSIKDLSNTTRIRVEYLRALEEENYKRIPGEVFIKGYITEYMKALGLDPAEALEIYKNEAVQPPSVEEAKERKGSLFSLKYASIGLVLILLIPALFLLKPSEKKEGFNLAKKPSFKKVKEASPGNEILNIIKPSVKTAEADYKNRHLLRVAAVEESWIMIRIDDDITYSMVLRPGEVKTWSAERGFYLKTGNAGGIEVSFDEIEIGSPGKRGAVVSLKLPEDLKKYKKTIN